ncbi:3'-5' exonuclease [Maribellus mangrovi]|uniref:3'-5' exonuclease n=1 Tax=Maribellus mangrovi TaxID=3133146 RepID=UPI0030EE06A7
MFSIIDIETTGNRFKYGKITEIAIYQHNGQRITDSYSTLINPEIDIPFFITELTGINNDMVKNAPKFYEVAKTIVEMTMGRTFVAHNAQFDYKFIREEFARLGYNYHRKTMCTVQLSRRLLPGHKSYSLGRLCSDLGIVIDGRHRAAGDALATTKLFDILIKNNEQNGRPENRDNLKLF